MGRTTLKNFLILLAGGTLCFSAWAEDMAIIVNKDNNNNVDKALVVKIYTGASRNWPDGGSVFAIDQGDESPVRADFYSNVIGKSSSNMKAVWARVIFTGKGLPPKVYDPDAEVKKVVSSNKNAIGYIRASSADSSVKVVAK